MDPTAYAENLRAAKACRSAASLLEKEGWVQNKWVSDEGRCISFAVYQANPRMTISDRQFAIDELQKSINGESIVRFNDAPGRTKEQVLDLLRNTAKRLETE